MGPAAGGPAGPSCAILAIAIMDSNVHSARPSLSARTFKWPFIISLFFGACILSVMNRSPAHKMSLKREHSAVQSRLASLAEASVSAGSARTGQFHFIPHTKIRHIVYSSCLDKSKDQHTGVSSSNLGPLTLVGSSNSCLTLCSQPLRRSLLTNLRNQPRHQNRNLRARSLLVTTSETGHLYLNLPPPLTMAN
jgi:hypothetical protein